MRYTGQPRMLRHIVWIALLAVCVLPASCTARTPQPNPTSLEDADGSWAADAGPGEARVDTPADTAPPQADTEGGALWDASVVKGPVVTTTRLFATIYEAPRLDATKLGTFRAGTLLSRSSEPLRTGCGKSGTRWWSLVPVGYVCEGSEGVTTDLSSPAVQIAMRYNRGDYSAPFPFGFATSYGAPFYTRIPTPKEQAEAEGNVAARVEAVQRIHQKMSPSRRPPRSARDIEPVPPLLLPGRPSATLLEDARGLTAGYAWDKLRVAVTGAFESEGRLFYLTSEQLILPADRMRAAKLADFRGVELTDENQDTERLPMAWVNWKPAPAYRYVRGAMVRTSFTFPVQGHASLTGKEVPFNGGRYWELVRTPSELAGDDSEARVYVKAGEVSRIDAEKELPGMMRSDDLWIDVAIGRQTLVLYRGLKPLFVTLVSTGVDGAGDPETTHSTPTGIYRIVAKHKSARMAAEEKPGANDGDPPDPRYRIDDVPYVQYFHKGYGFHAAWWHDAFGQPRSHGCVNLSPRDAAWLFGKTAPEVPDGWHGVYTQRRGDGGAAGDGTLVRIRSY